MPTNDEESKEEFNEETIFTALQRALGKVIEEMSVAQESFGLPENEILNSIKYLRSYCEKCNDS